MKKNHKHLILNAVVKNPINDETSCNDWLQKLVEIVDMEILIPPHSKYCDISGNEGITGTVVITTSHMSVHIWPQQPNPHIRMDVYSCKDFDAEKIITFVDTTMGVVESDYLLVDRNETKLKLI